MQSWAPLESGSFKGEEWIEKKGNLVPEVLQPATRDSCKAQYEEMRGLAISRGGRCLSSEYLGSRSKLLWECDRGDRWQALPTSIAQGFWCPTCARNQRLTLSQFQDMAASRGGACLSSRYVNERTMLTWRCAEGHQWNATPNKVKRGSWCSICAVLRRRGRSSDRGMMKSTASGRTAIDLQSEMLKSEATFDWQR